MSHDGAHLRGILTAIDNTTAGVHIKTDHCIVHRATGTHVHSMFNIDECPAFVVIEWKNFDGADMEKAGNQAALVLHEFISK